MTPLHKTTRVPLNPTDAFDLFIRGLDSWWPKDSHGRFGPDAVLTVEPHKNGKIQEIGPDGRIHVWGKILAWNPGTYLAYTWMIDGQDAPTVVAVSFHRSKDGTRLELTHGGFDILGDTVDAVSRSYLFTWDLVLGSYCAAATRAPVTA